MRTNRSKKDEEFTWLKSFINKYGKGLENMNIISTETPDFILENGRKSISVELTTLLDANKKKAEMLKKKILERARVKSSGKYVNNLNVAVGFADNPIEITANQIDAAATKILELVDELYEKENIKNERTLKSSTNYYDTGFVTSISISPNQSSSFWHIDNSFLVPKVDLAALRTTIVRKENNIKRYKIKCKEDWLIILSDLAMEESSTLDFSDITKDLRMTTRFHSVFIFQAISKKFIRLRLRFQKS